MGGQLEKDDKSNELSAREILLRQKLRQRARKSTSAESSKVPTKPTEPVQLSPYQRPLWLDYQMYPDRKASWIIHGYHLDGIVNLMRLTDTLSLLQERHWILTCAIDSDGKMYPQDTPIPLHKSTTSDDPWKEAQQFCRFDIEPFRLQEGKLFRVYVFEGDEQTVIAFAIHHILVDLPSIARLIEDLNVLFEDGGVDLASQSDLIETYAHQSLVLDKNRDKYSAFWQSALDQLPAAVPLPPVRSSVEPTERKGALARHKTTLQFAERCRMAASNAGVSPYQWFLAVWVILLARYLGKDDIHLGTTLSTRIGKDQKDAVGYFQNVLVPRFDLGSTQDFSDVLEEVRSVVGKALANGGLPLDELMRLTGIRPSGGQLFATLFTIVEKQPRARFLGKGVLKFEEFDYGGAAFDLTFFIVTSGDELSLVIEYDTAVYDSETIHALFNHYEALAVQLADDQRSEWRRCSLVDSEELAALRSEWRRISATPLPTQRLQDAFYEQAHANPNSVALRWGSGEHLEQVSYQDLATKADAVAGFINSVADSSDRVIAIIGAWQPDTVAAIIGILRSGRAYLPIDVDYPESRISHILQDADNPLVLLQTGAKVPDGYSDRCFSIADAIESELTPGPATDKPLAYVIYTSGSSGAPKGVRIGHGAAVYSTAERSRVYAEWPPHVFLLLSSFSFDSAVAGLWWTLSTGGCLRLASRETVRAADAVAELITSERITHTLCLASQWSDICRISQGPLDSMELVIVAGEACVASTIKHHIKRAPDAALFNEYGPTEMAVWSTCHRLKNGDVDPISIGGALSRTQALVMDEFGNIVPEGFSGELVLAGHGIGEGYIGGVSDGFTAHPLDPECRAYVTGDKVLRGTDHLLYFEGRVDEQVKFRGYRIGIESIEQALGGVAGEAAVIPWDGTSLEGLLAKLPHDEAHALVDKRLQAADVSAKD